MLNSKLLFVTIVFLLISPSLIQTTFSDETKENNKTTASVICPSQTSSVNLSSITDKIEYSLQHKQGMDWSNKKPDLSISYNNLSQNKKKFSFNIDAKQMGIYKAGFIIPFIAYNYTIDEYIIKINYSSFFLIYNFTDISLLHLDFEYGINKDNYFYFYATSKDNLNVGKYVWDPEWQLNTLSSNRQETDPCPSGTKLVRSTNGTLYSTYYTGNGISGSVVRSIDDGQTWETYKTIDFDIDQYDMCLAIDSTDKLHLFWASSWQNGMGMRYKNWTSAGVGSAVLNITTYNTDGPECPHMVINASDAIYFFWYNRFPASGNKYNLQNRTLYKGVLSETNNMTETKVNSSDGFMFGCCDNNDVIHVVWCSSESETVDGINYCNITENVQSDTLHLIYYDAVGDDDQTAPCIVCDNRNNLSVTWMGQYNRGPYYWTLHMYYWFANQTWSGIRHINNCSTDGSTYPYPFQTVDWDNTVYISVSGSNAGDPGQRYYKYGTNGTYASAVQLTTNYKTTNNFCLYQNYPQFSVGGSTIYTMRPKSGFSVYYWNASEKITYYNVSAYYSGITTINNPVDLTNPSPTNNSNQMDTTKCSITANDLESDTMDITFASNYTGAWVNYQTNSTVTDGTFQWNFSQANHNSQKYYWKVYANDGSTNISETYSFTHRNSTEWWNGDFPRCKRIDITNPLQYYVSNITVHYQSGYNNPTNGSISAYGCRPDFADLRVIGADNVTELPYWISTNYTASGKCELYFNNSQNDSYVWLYYGNSLAKTTSNGTTTFLEFFNKTTGWSAHAGVSDLYLSKNGSFLNFVKNMATGEHWKYRTITLGNWKNVTLEVQTSYQQIGGAGNYNIVYMISETSHTLNFTAQSFYHRTTEPTIYGYKFGTNGVGAWLYNDTTPYKRDITMRADINTVSNEIDYYLYNKTDDKYFVTRQGQSFDAPAATSMNYFGMLVPASVIEYYIDVNFTGGIRIKPFSENPPTIASFSEVYIVNYTTPLNATNITTTTATLRGRLVEDTNVPNLVGFYVYTSEPIFPYESNALYNITYGITNTTTNSGYFQYNLTSLTSAEYYYVKTWCYNGSRWDVSNSTTYFLTLPNPISSLTALDSYYTTAVSLQWLNPTVPTGTNLSIAIYYSTSPITSRGDGVLGANISCTSGTLQSKTIYGLGDNTNYYFTAWTQINASGSPKLYQQAGSLVWTQAETGRGNFNVSFFNETNPLVPINLSLYGPHTIDVIYNNKTEHNIIKNGVVTNESSGDWANLDKGFIWLNCSFAPLYIDVYWNNTEGGWGGQYYGTTYHSIGDTTTTEYISIEDTFVDNTALCLLEAFNGSWWTVQAVGACNGTFLYNDTYQVNAGTVHAGNTTLRFSYYYSLIASDVDYRCHRKQIFHEEENMSIYLAIEHPVYGITTSHLTNQTLIPYTYSFSDSTGYFADATDIDTYITIYTYDKYENQLIIHEEFWDATDQIYPWLIYGKSYFIGVTCEELSIERLGITPTGSNTNPTIVIDYTSITGDQYLVNEIFTFNPAIKSTGFYFNIIDSSGLTTEMTLSIYNFTTGYLINRSYAYTYSYNFTNATLPLNNYILQLNITSTGFDENITLLFDIYSAYWTDYSITTFDFLNLTFTTMFGNTPFVNKGNIVSWVYIAIILIDIILIFTFSGFSGEPAVGGMAVGFWHIGATVLISGVAEVVLVLGIFIILLSVFYMYRGGKK